MFLFVCITVLNDESTLSLKNIPLIYIDPSKQPPLIMQLTFGDVSVMFSCKTTQNRLTEEHLLN